jgi:hypothetical protein
MGSPVKENVSGHVMTLEDDFSYYQALLFDISVSLISLLIIE